MAKTPLKLFCNVGIPFTSNLNWLFRRLGEGDVDQLANYLLPRRFGEQLGKVSSIFLSPVMKLSRQYGQHVIGRNGGLSRKPFGDDQRFFALGGCCFLELVLQVLILVIRHVENPRTSLAV